MHCYITRQILIWVLLKALQSRWLIVNKVVLLSINVIELHLQEHLKTKNYVRGVTYNLEEHSFWRVE